MPTMEIEEAANYIKQLEADIKHWRANFNEERKERVALRKECEKLKEERHKVIQDAYQCHYDTWKAEQENIVITELKEENEQLNIVIMDLKEENEQLEEKNKKLKEKHEHFRVRNCDRMEEYVKALSPWKKNYQDHKRILEAIGELKEELEWKDITIQKEVRRNDKLTKKIEGVTICLTSVAECLNK